jgi:hypothetical protein
VLQYSADYGPPSLQLAPDRGHYLISVIISPRSLQPRKEEDKGGNLVSSPEKRDAFLWSIDDSSLNLSS